MISPTPAIKERKKERNDKKKRKYVQNKRKILAKLIFYFFSRFMPAGSNKLSLVNVTQVTHLHI